VLPRNLRPIRLSRRIEPFDCDQFIYELKIEGFRALAHTEAGRGELISENGNVFRGFAISPHGSQNTFAWKAQSPMRELRFSFAEAKPVQGFLMVRKHFSGYPPILSDEHAESVRSWRFSYQRNSWVHLS
jgi:hypothetical protein